MIDEIKNPLPTIKSYLQFLANKKKNRKQKKDLEGNVINDASNLTDLDVCFNGDTSMIEEFSEKLGISYSLAEASFISFFEELKLQLMEGRVTFVVGLGKFYVSAPCRNVKGKFSMPNLKKRIIPKLSAFDVIRDYDKNKV